MDAQTEAELRGTASLRSRIRNMKECVEELPTVVDSRELRRHLSEAERIADSFCEATPPACPNVSLGHSAWRRYLPPAALSGAIVALLETLRALVT